MDDQPNGASGDDADHAHPASPDTEVGPAAADPVPSPASEIVDLPWDDDLPVALGEETEPGTDDQRGRAQSGGATAADDADDGTGTDQVDGREVGGDDGLDGLGDDEDDDDDPDGGRRTARRRRVDTWRSRTATGAIASAIAMGLQQVFEPERRRPAAVAEAPSDPYDDDDPITVDYVPDDAEATKVHVKPWLLQKGDPT